MNLGQERVGSKKGFTLLEVIIALAIFSAAAIGLLQALNVIGLATSEASRRNEVNVQLRSLLTEACHDPDFRAGIDRHEDLIDGVLFEVRTEALSMSSDNGVDLNDMFTVTVRAMTAESPRGDRNLNRCWVPWSESFIGNSGIERGVVFDEGDYPIRLKEKGILSDGNHSGASDSRDVGRRHFRDYG